jgi:hypothetical protein
LIAEQHIFVVVFALFHATERCSTRKMVKRMNKKYYSVVESSDESYVSKMGYVSMSFLLGFELFDFLYRVLYNIGLKYVSCLLVA